MGSGNRYKVTSPTLPNQVLHSTPVDDNSNSSKGKKSFPKSKIPSHVADLEFDQKDKRPDSIDTFNSSVSSTSKAYDLSRIKSLEPTIVFSSDFVPIYDGDELNNVGKSLQIKEAAQQMTAITAVNALLNPEMKNVKKLILDNTTNLELSEDLEGSARQSVWDNLGKIRDSLNLSKHPYYVYESYSDQGYPQTNMFFSTFLFKEGFSSNYIKNFSQTKLWQQSLLEAKRILLSHSSNLLSIIPDRSSLKNEDDPYILSDIKDKPHNSKRIWINIYAKLPDIAELSYANLIEENISKITQFSRFQYIDLFDTNSLQETKLFEKSNVKSSNFTGNIDMSPYQESGRDIAIIGNILSKEISFSKNIKFYSNDLKTYGFSESQTGDNFSVWDYLFGRFSSSVLDFDENPSGNGKSLFSLSQDIVKKDDSIYNVLTFEDSFLQQKNNISQKKSTLTPGIYYYVDSSLTIDSNRNFDVSRVTNLLKKTRISYDTLLLIYNMLKIDNQKGNVIGHTADYWSSGEFDIFSYTKGNLIRTLKFYHKIISSPEYKSSNSLFDEKGNLSSKITNEDSVGVRLASLICKIAVKPTSGYNKNYKRIKSLLFLWLMNSAMMNPSSPAGNQSNNQYDVLFLQKIKRMLVKELSLSTVSLKKEEELMTGRMFPCSISDESGLIDKAAGITEYSDIFESNNSSSQNSNPFTSNNNNASGNFKSSIQNQNYTNVFLQNIFKIDSNQGVWKEIVDLLRNVYLNTSDYSSSTNPEVTGYSGMKSSAYLFSFFDFILRIIASYTPENLLGVYSKKYLSSNNVEFTETGLFTDNPNKATVEEYFDLSKTSYGFLSISKKIPLAYDFFSKEYNYNLEIVGSLLNYVSGLEKSLSDFLKFLTVSKNTFLNILSPIVDNDQSLSEQQKIDLINTSLSLDQLVFGLYMESEFSDKIDRSKEGSLIERYPTFKNMPLAFKPFLPFDEFSLISFSTLKEYFKSIEFQNSKANNKKILSIGLPVNFYRSIISKLNFTNNAKENIIRIKIYKLDRLHPGIVYKPKEFLFEMQRFPTRELNNWTSFIGNNNPIDQIPTKSIQENTFVINSGINDSRTFNSYGESGDPNSFLTYDERDEIYKNHATSFLIEEYMRWFTDVNFDETRFYNYSSLSKLIPSVEDQYKSLIDSIRKDISEKNIDTSKNTGINIQLDSYDQNPSIVFPYYSEIEYTEKNKNLNKNLNMIRTFNSTLPSTSNRPNIQNRPALGTTINFTQTIKSYFLNETFFMNPDYLKRRLFYPKKFDRVFNVIIDPDDYEVDTQMTDVDSLEILVKNGVINKTTLSINNLTGYVSPQKYLHRDTSPSDIYFDEYFVTIEPYEFESQ